jgi:hypothetical protein
MNYTNSTIPGLFQDGVYQLLVHGRWFSPGTPASSTTKTGCHNIAEILLTVALKHQKSKIKSISGEQSEIYCRTYKISWNPVTLTCPVYDKKKRIIKNYGSAANMHFLR